MSAADELVVLTSAGGRLAAKRFTMSPDGTLTNRDYDEEMWFSVSHLPLASFRDLAAALASVERQQFSLVIRAELKPQVDGSLVRRLLYDDEGYEAPFQEKPRHWFLIDIDHVACPAAIDPVGDPEGAVEYLIGLLPPELHDAWCWWQFSSSQGLPGKGETLSAHLWFWSASPLDGAALTRWAAAANNQAGYKLIDTALFRPVQVHYVARA
jgi:hypothetical protein